MLEERIATNSQAAAIGSLYTYGHTLISQQRLSTLNSQPSTNFYGYDGHGNVRYLTDTNAAVTDTYDYDAFGNLIARTGSTVNNYLFTGEQYDADLGLYYLRARYQNTDTGRFWTQDSFEGFGSDPSSLHKYTYCGNNPINAFDATGHEVSLAEVANNAAIGGYVNLVVSSIMKGLGTWAGGGSLGDAYKAANDGAYDDFMSGAFGGAVGYGFGKFAFWGLGKIVPYLLDSGPVQALIAYVRESTLLNRAYTSAQQAWNALDAAVVQGSEAAIRSSLAALQQADAAITGLSATAERDGAAALGLDALFGHIGGSAGRDCTAITAEMIANELGITGREGLIQALRNYVADNNITTMREAILRMQTAIGRDAIESTSWGAAEPGVYAVFDGNHVIFGKVFSNGSRLILDGSQSQGFLMNQETDYLMRAEAVLFGRLN